MNTTITKNRTNPYVGAKYKKDIEKNIVLQVSNIEPIQNYPVKIAFHWHCKNKRKDPDNIATGQKYILDALQKSQILEGDGWKQIIELSHKFSIDKEDPRVHVVFYVD